MNIFFDIRTSLEATLKKLQLMQKLGVIQEEYGCLKGTSRLHHLSVPT